MTFAVDFDGTCVGSAFPDIGPDVPDVVTSLKELVEAGHALILHTCRWGKFLEGAVRWFGDRKIPLAAVGKEIKQGPYSSKVYADFYIDDKAVGVPLTHPEGFAYPCVNWVAVMAIIRTTDFSKVAQLSSEALAAIRATD